MPFVSPSDLRAATAALIATVPGSGRVHKRRRIVRDDVTLKTHLWDQTQQKIVGWMVSPDPSAFAISERNPGHIGHGVKGGGNVLTTFRFQIEGFHVVDDANASEETFQDLAWSVADEFNSYGTIPAAGGGPMSNVFDQGACDIDQLSYIMFAGSILLHFARLTIWFKGRTRV